MVPSPSVLLSVSQVGAWDTYWVRRCTHRVTRCMHGLHVKGSMHAGHNVEGGALPLPRPTGGVITRQKGRTSLYLLHSDAERGGGVGGVAEGRGERSLHGSGGGGGGDRDGGGDAHAGGDHADRDGWLGDAGGGCNLPLQAGGVRVVADAATGHEREYDRADSDLGLGRLEQLGTWVGLERR